MTFVSSLAMEDEHTLTYESEDGRLGYCDHTPKRKNGDFGKSYRHWHIDGKVYKTKEKFLRHSQTSTRTSCPSITDPIRTPWLA